MARRSVQSRPCETRLYRPWQQHRRPVANLQRAVEMLMPEAFPARLSGVYESEPWGFASEHHFLNAVCEVQTERSRASC